MEQNVEITVHGGRLDRPVTIKDGTYVYDTMLPDDALQDCETCEKVELMPENVPVANCYSMLISQQQRSAMGGHRLGLRMEAVVALLGWLQRTNQIEEPALVMQRIWILDDIYNRIQNARIDAETEKSKTSK